MSVTNISAKELSALISSGEELELIDVREAYEFADSHLKGAKHISMSMVPLKLNEIDFTKKVVFYCRSGARSYMVAQTIASRENKDIINLDGGMIEVEDEASELIAQ